MSWKIRHQGSPKSIERLTLPEIVEGLQDGLWEPTDEVMGPDDLTWTAIEDHPQLADVALDIDPMPPPYHADETRLDMTALIDVTLVLLIFFILTTSYAALQKMLDAPGGGGDKNLGLLKVTEDQVRDLMIKVEVRQVGDDSVIKVEGQEVQPNELLNSLSRFVKDTRRTELLLDYSPDVPYGVIVSILDAAKGAKITLVHNLAPPEDQKAP
jgi:biopolymer transport protein ExbD